MIEQFTAPETVTFAAALLLMLAIGAVEAVGLGARLVDSDAGVDAVRRLARRDDRRTGAVAAMSVRGALAVALVALAVPAAAQDEDAICTDRPGKGTAPCTVPAGRVQVESDLVALTHDHQPGETSDLLVAPNASVKYGLDDRTDAEVSWAPYERLRARELDDAASVHGVGDVFLRVKRRLTAADAPLGVALLPAVKLPTAKRPIGNRGWEAALTVPVSLDVTDTIALAAAPEIDWLKDEQGGGHHLAVVQVVGVTWTPGRVGLSAELWTEQDYDPAGTERQYSADAAVAWTVTRNLQLDLGGNFGLNRATPDAQIYTGLSLRF